eukprot:TRINITY_DN3368_c0_g1_i1.p1 TRINITY_DN3368_c0_g1~~TRINITY_DN3368_c0_g1_i1.p1  ORF type:complete len:500 (+),score=75.91 TRINITY_DN3368_c0_g1_i1:187-1500(+)
MGLAEFFTTLIEQNPYFKAGAGLAGMGMVVAVGRRMYGHSLVLARRMLVVSMEVPSKDKSYPWMLRWLGEQGMRTQHVSVETSQQKGDSGRVHTTFGFVPSPGRHVFMHPGHIFPIVVERTREKQALDISSGVMWESVTLSTLGIRREIFRKILSEARKLAIEHEEGKTVIFTSFGPEWRPFGNPRRRRPLSSVILDDNVSERILHDVLEFNDSLQWYIDRGIPYRRGYLLHGPPGNGKSSFVAALAGEIGYNICVLSLSESGLSDDRLNHLLTVAPQRSIILLEDIDAALPMVNRASTDDKASNQNSQYAPLPNTVTFSGLLNALDGVASGEERIVFMTTNYPERLDAALTRPGRVDMVQYIGHATESQAYRMFLKFFPSAKKEALEFSDYVKGIKVSMAQLQGFFMMHKISASDAISSKNELVEGGTNDTRNVQV